MAQLTFDGTATRRFETGVDHGVLYVMDTNGDYPLGVAWNGLVSVTEAPSGGEATALWADNMKYLNLFSAEELGLTIEAYTYPTEWEQCDGGVSPEEGLLLSQQTRKKFGLVYRTKIGNDVTEDLGYKYHLVYGCQASPSEKAFQTINDSPDAVTFSWEIKTTPVPITGYKPTAILTVDSTKAPVDALADLLEALYGTDGIPGTAPYLPDPSAVLTMFGVT